MNGTDRLTVGADKDLCVLLSVGCCPVLGQGGLWRKAGALLSLGGGLHGLTLLHDTILMLSNAAAAS